MPNASPNSVGSSAARTVLVGGTVFRRLGLSAGAVSAGAISVFILGQVGSWFRVSCDVKGSRILPLRSMMRCISFGSLDIQKAMPKKPAFIHPLRQIRDAISQVEKQCGRSAMSQARFAKLLGVSRITIAKIENGKLGVSVEMQRRILNLFGGEIPLGMTTETVEVFDEFEDRNYCAESWKAWSQHLDQVGKMSPDDLANGLIQSIRILMLAAKDAKRELETKATVYNVLREVARNLKLEKATVKVIDRLPKAKRPTQSGGEHRSRIVWPVSDYFAPLVAPILNAEVSKRWPDSREQTAGRSQQRAQK